MEDVSDLTLSKLLKRRREELGLTLRDVEHITQGKVSNAYLSQIETGKVKEPSLVMLHRLSAAYSLDFGELVSWSLRGEKPFHAPICPACGQVIRNAALSPTGGA